MYIGMHTHKSCHVPAFEFARSTGRNVRFYTDRIPELASESSELQHILTLTYVPTCVVHLARFIVSIASPATVLEPLPLYPCAHNQHLSHSTVIKSCAKRLCRLRASLGDVSKTLYSSQKSIFTSFVCLFIARCILCLHLLILFTFTACFVRSQVAWHPFLLLHSFHS